MEINIDSWDRWDCDRWYCWYCVLSILETICPVDASFLYVLPMRPSVFCPNDVSFPLFFTSIDISIDLSIFWYIDR